MSWIGQVTVTGGLVNIPITSADTGHTYLVVLGPGEEHLQHLKQKLSVVSSVPTEEQILLYGPPYKSIDSSFTRSPLIPGSKVFLYDRRLIQNESSIANSEEKFKLEAVELSNEPIQDAPIELLNAIEKIGQFQSPLLQTVSTYERQFMVALNKGQALFSNTVILKEECTRGWKEAESQKEALSAAILNLSDHMNILFTNFNDVIFSLERQNSKHQTLLDSFEFDISALGKVNLHPALIPKLTSALKSNKAPSTLLDCVPLERERSLFATCQESHQRVNSQILEAKKSIQEVARVVEELLDKYCKTNDSPLPNEREKKAIGVDEDKMELSWVISEQEKFVQILKGDYETVLNMALEQFKLAGSKDLQQSSGSWSSSSMIGLVQDFDQRFNAQAEVIPKMQKIDDKLRSILERAKAGKVEQGRILRRELREVSSLQSKIQEMQKWIAVMKLAREKKEEQFMHLEKVKKMPSSHSALVSEVVRRKAYGSLLAARATKVAEEASSLRSAEIVARDVFLRGEMVNLPPVFMEAIPSLAYMPSLFAPTVLDLDNKDLPDITQNDEGWDVNVFTKLIEEGRNAREKSGECEGEYGPQKGSLILEAGDKKPDIEMDQSFLLKNAELNYENSLLKTEILRMQSIVRRSLPDDSFRTFDKSTGTDSIERTEEATQISLAVVSGSTQTDFEAMAEKSFSEGLDGIRKAVEKWNSDHSIFNKVNKESITMNDLALEVENALKSASNKIIQVQNNVEGRIREAARGAANGRISFRNFVAGDLALFLPTTDGSDRIYLAFHMGCPHPYLARESVDEICRQMGRYPDFILGRVVMVEQLIAPEFGSNPYHVAPGKAYYLLTASSF
mmetsp:Transcript_17017/g.25157  ORF Transcript_17017/g.25157 Transcript_17017/m.25157 type:complete len:851 (+) Transcript_17017:128-2680(+)|eukprot:CAMPEP_0171458392 /NCGR_PEP_ID=MMETSP0945-20130129/4090_1 /TAXON_ID=109269 /ORGANISM="Vaucheria litorea, Strain CCMP2940" /LENGTH=850 /DNA_ID=CAMNT_0011984193 /DNA_START=127 /DNA_END=2679 /DNA_ORIENTATION=+